MAQQPQTRKQATPFTIKLRCLAMMRAAVIGDVVGKYVEGSSIPSTEQVQDALRLQNTCQDPSCDWESCEVTDDGQLGVCVWPICQAPFVTVIRRYVIVVQLIACFPPYWPPYPMPEQRTRTASILPSIRSTLPLNTRRGASPIPKMWGFVPESSPSLLPMSLP